MKFRFKKTRVLIQNRIRIVLLLSISFNLQLSAQNKLLFSNNTKLMSTSSTNNFLIVGFFLFFLTTSYFIIHYYRNVFFEKQKELDIQKQGLLKKEKKIEQTITYKNQQLTSYAFSFQQKDAIINKVFSLARCFEKTSSYSEEKKLIQELIHIGKENLHIDKEWEHFRLFFEETLAGFHTKLKSKHPELNSNDLKICSLIRLNLNIKEAANILNISPGSLKTARYRLRKKLDLQSGQKIIDYILKVEKEEFSL